ncbi:MAG: hypothetical protein SWY16_04565 [Cyanobacteriota bacterium]|nr:hypothetical protein [Cyanobacteriota bacterium]
MRQTVEQRLKKLYDQRAALETQIKKIEAEKTKELRQHQEKRERLAGKAIYALVKSGAWSEEQLLELVEPHLKRASERALFGLETDDKAATIQPQQTEASTMAKSKKTKPKAKTPAKPKSSKPKAEPVTQSELHDEFNL